MRSSSRRFSATAAAVALLGSIVVGAPATADDATSISVSQTLDLIDRQEVRVEGTFETANTGVVISVCHPDADLSSALAAYQRCDIVLGSTPAPDVDATVELPAVAFGNDGAVIRCRVVACNLVVADFSFTNAVATPLSFLPHLRVTPNVGASGTEVKLRAAGRAFVSASVIVCLPSGDCDTVGPAAITGDRVQATFSIDREITLADGIVATCPPTGCSVGFRLVDPSLEGGTADLVAPFAFSPAQGSLDPSAGRAGTPARLRAVVPGATSAVTVLVCRADAVFDTLDAAAESCSLPTTLPTSGPVVDADYALPGAFVPAFSGDSVSCAEVDCVVALLPRLEFPADPVLIPFAIRTDILVRPSTGLADGDVVTVATDELTSVPGAAAFVMQCGFLAQFELRCGPTGTVVPDFAGGDFNGSIEVQQSFTAGGTLVACDVDAVCVLFVLVLGTDLEATDGRVQVVEFAAA